MFQWWSKFKKSFYYAIQGIKASFRERNMKIHILMGSGVILAGFYFGLSPVEWAIILILIALVLGAEVINTSIEELANVVRKDKDDDYGVTKLTRDLAAGAVLIIAGFSALVGLIIFGPKIF